jgi:hypothetical protein
MDQDQDRDQDQDQKPKVRKIKKVVKQEVDGMKKYWVGFLADGGNIEDCNT